MPVMEKPTTEYLTPKEVAKELDVAYTTVLNWIDQKKLRAYRYGGRLKVRREDLKTFIENSQTDKE